MSQIKQDVEDSTLKSNAKSRSLDSQGFDSCWYSMSPKMNELRARQQVERTPETNSTPVRSERTLSNPWFG